MGKIGNHCGAVSPDHSVVLKDRFYLLGPNEPFSLDFIFFAVSSGIMKQEGFILEISTYQCIQDIHVFYTMIPAQKY